MATPPTPTNIGPTGTITTGTPTLRATIARATSHEPVHAQWQIANDAGFTSIVLAPDEGGTFNDNGGTHYYTLPLVNHIAAGVYYIRARARSSVADSALSAGVSFTIAHPPVGTPTSPANNQAFVFGTGAVTFAWDFSSADLLSRFPAGYQIQVIVNDGSFTSVWDSGAVLGGAQVSATHTISGTYNNTYLAWRVKVTDPEGTTGAYSGYQPFWLQDPPSIAITTPSTLVTSPSPTVTHTFSSAVSATQTMRSYTVTRATDGVVVHSSGSQLGTGLTYDIPLGVLENKTKYIVTVNAADSHGIVGTDTQAFSTSWIKPAVPGGTSTDVSLFDSSGYVRVLWDNSTADANYLSYRVYRKDGWPKEFLQIVNGRIVDGNTPFYGFGDSNNNFWNDTATRIQYAVEMGANIVRVNDWLTSSKNITGLYNDEAAWVYVDQFVASARDAGLRVLLDLSTYRNLVKNAYLNPYTNNFVPFLMFVANRVNTVTGITYSDDPTIGWISWAGEPTPGGEPLSAITAASWTTGHATITLFANHQLQVGDLVTVKNANPSGYNVNGALITAKTSNTLSYAVASNPGTYVGAANAYMYTPQASIQQHYFNASVVLRQQFPNHLISAGGILHYDSASDGGDSHIDWQALSALDFDILSLHVYSGTDFVVSGTDEGVVPTIAAYMNARSIPWAIEEFGINQGDYSDTNRATHFTNLFNLAKQNGAQGALFWNGGTELIETWSTLNFLGKYASGTTYSALDAVTDGTHATTSGQTVANVTTMSGNWLVASTTGFTGGSFYVKTSTGIAEFVYASAADGTHLTAPSYVSGSGSVAIGAPISDGAPWVNLVGSVGVSPNDAHSSDWGKIKPVANGGTFDVNPMTPLTFAAVQANAPAPVDVRGDWVLLAETTDVSLSYEYDDYTAGSGNEYDYAVVQVYSDSGIPVESDYDAVIANPQGDNYFISVPSDPTLNMRIYAATADSLVDEHESAELELIGRGRQIQQGTEWGYRSTLTVNLRDIEAVGQLRAVTAGTQRAVLEQIRRTGAPAYLRDPFGYVYYIVTGDIQFDRDPGVGLREEGTLTIPYIEVVTP